MKVSTQQAAAKRSIEKKSLEVEYDRLWEDPFDPKTRRMTTVHRRKDGKVYAFIKGSPESILSICSKIRENGSIVNLDADKIKNIHKTVEEMTAKSYRVLLIAYKELNGEERQEDNYHYAVTRDAILLGTVGIYDPPRPEAKEAVQFMKEANTRVVLITGDHPVTARAVAKELRIGCDNDNDNNNNITVLTGGEFGENVC